MYIHYNDDTCIERGPQMVDCNYVWFHIRYTLSVNVFTTGQWLHYKRDQHTCIPQLLYLHGGGSGFTWCGHLITCPIRGQSKVFTTVCIRTIITVSCIYCSTNSYTTYVQYLYTKCTRNLCKRTTKINSTEVQNPPRKQFMYVQSCIVPSA